jgi:hypothetical protein
MHVSDSIKYIQEIVEYAQKEETISRNIDSITKSWKTMTFTLVRLVLIIFTIA